MGRDCMELEWIGVSCYVVCELINKLYTYQNNIMSQIKIRHDEHEIIILLLNTYLSRRCE